MNLPAFVGVDNGGTTLRIHALDRLGRSVFSLRFPSPPLRDLAGFLAKVLKPQPENPKPQVLVVGSKGVWTPSEKSSLLRKLSGLAETVFIFSDVELAYDFLLGGGPGVLLIAGTGSIAYGRNGRRIARAGGLGPDKGDEGSGYWIGKRHLAILNESAKPPKETAALAKRVLQLAEKGDSRPRFIVREAALHLCALVRRAARDLRLGPTHRLALHGGLFENRYFRSEFAAALRRHAPGTAIKMAPSKEGAAVHAARMGLNGSWKKYLRAANPPR